MKKTLLAALMIAASSYAVQAGESDENMWNSLRSSSHKAATTHHVKTVHHTKVVDDDQVVLIPSQVPYTDAEKKRDGLIQLAEAAAMQRQGGVTPQTTQDKQDWRLAQVRASYAVREKVATQRLEMCFVNSSSAADDETCLKRAREYKELSAERAKVDADFVLNDKSLGAFAGQ